ncbi:tyrosine-type recombinase/integrase [Shewanella avicenniae]|uniref:Tyrosine-type recombinase/integrase n=1 Tax=Shewanella avicenniae TaxID=2814294 RepID=A0ABX7QS18_9GAMM|nr:gamma-mobile-trio recombinase GmtY [Shewanella avicenniae]QSX33746.1 tyrosine-type recombinase/integrase [Shewanella avicenniae]
MDYVLKRIVEFNAFPGAKPFVVHALFTEKGVLISHLRYLYRHRSKSQSWLERSAFAVELLLTFIHANSHLEQSAKMLLANFVDALNFGTVDNDCFDESGLYWSPRKINDTNTLLGHINSYCDFLDSEYGTEVPHLNPMRKATKGEERMLWCAYYRRTANCFLNHLRQPVRAKLSFVREVRSLSQPFVIQDDISRFPDDLFSTFLELGIHKRDGTPDLCTMLILILMHFGGLRLSECFHIYIHDVMIDRQTGSSIIKVYHPSDGNSPERFSGNRREYLNVRYRLKPRNEYPRSHKLYSGWKSPLLTDNKLSFEVFFCPPNISLEFTKLLQQYLMTNPRNDHPYLFSNHQGAPESKKNFIKKYTAAVNRLSSYSQLAGCGPHSHRHAYGYRLAQNGMSQTDIQKAMHHKSPESCLVYIRPTDADVRVKMRGFE